MKLCPADWKVRYGRSEVWRQAQLRPRYVDRELAEYLRCGILAHGFARVRCSTCHDELLVAFSCKRHAAEPRRAVCHAIAIDTGYVNAIPLPADFIADKEYQKAIQDAPLATGPEFYVGKSRPTWFRP